MSDSDDTIEYEPHFFGIVPDGTAAHTICAVCREESKPRPSRNIRSVGDIEQRRLETEHPEVM